MHQDAIANQPASISFRQTAEGFVTIPQSRDHVPYYGKLGCRYMTIAIDDLSNNRMRLEWSAIHAMALHSGW